MIARKYLYLIALAREQHFGRAAEACHVSSSTLSAAIKDIETELGVTVVERGQQFVGLTAEGRCVLAHARRLADGVAGDDTSHPPDGLGQHQTGGDGI